MDIQTLTLEGKEFVILPRDEFEDMVDTASAKKILADVSSGKEELIPSNVVKALIAGGNPVRIWRKHRELSAVLLAQMTGLSAAYISEIENNKKTGSISAMKKIAAALRVDIDDLV